MRVLVADDDTVALLVLVRNLTKWGYEVVTAGDGLQAWDILAADDSIQMVILDWIMPGVPGLELSSRIKRDLSRPVYVLLLTVNSEPDDIALGLDAGADEYVVKPFNTRELRARLRAGERIITLENSLVGRVKELEEAEDKLKRSNQDLEAFAYVASHDLNEPLRKIRVFSDRLLETCSDSLPGHAADYVERMVGAVKRMEKLLQGVLNLSRIPISPAVHVPVDLNQIVREVLSDLEVAIDNTAAQIDLKELPTVLADPLQMRQLMQNLISNALKFHLPETSPHIKVYWECSGEALATTATMATIVVEDDGIGFDPAFLDQIFLPFKRLNGLGEYEGSGMGLAICHRIVESHNGWVRAVSQEGKGSKFAVTLPSALAFGLCPRTVACAAGEVTA